MVVVSVTGRTSHMLDINMQSIQIMPREKLVAFMSHDLPFFCLSPIIFWS